MLHAHTSQNEWVVDSGCTHHMAKDDFPLSSLDKVIESKIYVVDELAIDIIRHGDIPCRHGRNVDVYHVSSLSSYLLSISQLKQTSNIVEFWPNHFFVKDIKNDRLIFLEGCLNSKDLLYNFCDFS